jgi:hypothetical protein
MATRSLMAMLMTIDWIMYRARFGFSWEIFSPFCGSVSLQQLHTDIEQNLASKRRTFYPSLILLSRPTS